MDDLQQTIIGALQQAGLHDPQMLQQITASVMQGLGGQPPSPLPGFGQATGQPAPMAPVGQAMGRQLVPGFSGPAPSELYGYEGQPNRDLLASQSFGRGPAPASIDPRAEGDIQQGIAAEMGQQPPMMPSYAALPNMPGMVPPGQPPQQPWMSPGMSLAGDALGLRKPDVPKEPPLEPGLKAKPVSLAPRKGMFGKAKGGMLSESDRLNWEQVMARDPSKVPPAIRSLLGA